MFLFLFLNIYQLKTKQTWTNANSNSTKATILSVRVTSFGTDFWTFSGSSNLEHCYFYSTLAHFVSLFSIECFHIYPLWCSSGLGWHHNCTYCQSVLILFCNDFRQVSGDFIFCQCFMIQKSNEAMQLRVFFATLRFRTFLCRTQEIKASDDDGFTWRL